MVRVCTDTNIEETMRIAPVKNDVRDVVDAEIEVVTGLQGDDLSLRNSPPNKGPVRVLDKQIGDILRLHTQLL
jgi:hypothetical protein